MKSSSSSPLRASSSAFLAGSQRSGPAKVSMRHLPAASFSSTARSAISRAEDDVVVELALRPVGDQVVPAEPALHLVEQRAE
jgi:hypothetical protein